MLTSTNGSWNLLKLTSMLVLSLSVVGCGATHTAINKRELSVSTEMTDSIFLDPLPENKRKVFVEVRNTSDKPQLSIEPQVKFAIADKGFEIVKDPNKAYYIVQANVLKVGVTD